MDKLSWYIVQKRRIKDNHCVKNVFFEVRVKPRWNYMELFFVTLIYPLTWQSYVSLVWHCRKNTISTYIVREYELLVISVSKQEKKARQTFAFLSVYKTGANILYSIM